jgi:hypothetical protein
MSLPHPLSPSPSLPYPQKDDARQYILQFVLHASLDVIEEVIWTQNAMNLAMVDRYNDMYVAAYNTAGNVRFLLLTDQKGGEDAIKNFFRVRQSAFYIFSNLTKPVGSGVVPSPHLSLPRPSLPSAGGPRAIHPRVPQPLPLDVSAHEEPALCTKSTSPGEAISLLARRWGGGRHGNFRLPLVPLVKLDSCKHVWSQSITSR